MTRTQKISPEQAERYQKDLLTHERLLWARYNDEKPDEVVSLTEDGDVYTYELWGGRDPHGGIVVGIFRARRQRAQVFTVSYLDDLHPTEHWPETDRIAIERLTISRNNLWDVSRVG